ncbi:MAG: glycerate kinase, partial [Gemmatimonadetes bacterium]|nr:glycerate kinase [Gemmatimonadota bacterium]
REAVRRARSTPRAACFLSGGETTVVVTGPGTGGRNQELVLAAAIELAGVDHVTIAAVGTDGIDGPTDAAGAVADGTTVSTGRTAGFDAVAALARNDSYTFLAAADALIRTGPTGTNVMDVQVALVDPA